ncbi:MAG: hypothetical protein AB1894_23885 [Chloroflexota bacterium]
MYKPIFSPKPRRSAWLPLALACLVIVQLACQALSPGGPSDFPTPPNTPAATTQPSEPPAASPAAPTPAASLAVQPTSTQPLEQPTPGAGLPPGEGLACFASLSEGVACLSAAGWQLYTRENSSLGSDSIQDVTACPDGRIAAAHSNGVSVFDGQRWIDYQGELSMLIGASGVACDAQGGLWVSHIQGVAHFDGQDWRDFSASEVTQGGSTIFDDIAVAPDGVVWTLTNDSVSRFDGTSWQVFKEGQGFNKNMFFGGLALAADGTPWVAYSGGVAFYEAGVWEQRANSKLGSANGLALDAQGRVWLASSADGLFMFEDGGWTQYDTQALAGVSKQVQAVAVDASGRVWAASKYGLAVFDGANWTSYFMHTAELVDNELRSAAVSQGGPPLPAPLEKATGTLSARILGPSGQPVADAPVEICVETLGPSYYGETPCSGQPFLQKTQTDADGRFKLSDLPGGYYIITVYAQGGWSQLVGQFGAFSERVLVRPGQDSEVGDINLQ